MPTKKKTKFEVIEKHLFDKHDKSPPNNVWAFNYANHNHNCQICIDYVISD